MEAPPTAPVYSIDMCDMRQPPPEVLIGKELPAALREYRLDCLPLLVG